MTLNCLIVGDVMLDEFISGNIDRGSPEAQCNILNIHSKELFIGGAGNTAQCLALAGCNVKLLCQLNYNDAAGQGIMTLKSENLDIIKVNSGEGSTITKTRLLNGDEHLLRVDFESLDEHKNPVLPNNIKDIVRWSNIIILSDYNKGTNKIFKKIIGDAKEASIPVLVDGKNSDLSTYYGATIFKVNSNEYKAICKFYGLQDYLTFVDPKNKQLQNQLIDLSQRFSFKNFIVTLGANGVIFIDENQNLSFLPAEKIVLKDVVGAGDVLIATLAYHLSKGYSLSCSVKKAVKSATNSVKHPMVHTELLLD